MKTMKRAILPTLLIVLILMAGCATAPVQQDATLPAKRTLPEQDIPKEDQGFYVYDPWEPLNRRIYIFNAAFDQQAFLPLVGVYEFFLPDVAQTGVSNFFKNLREITNFMNSALQFKGTKAATTLARVVVNTTIGVGGLMDVASGIEGMERVDEDFGQTLGFYGLGPGPYLVLPILGPSNLRDTGGLVVDSVVYGYVVQQLIAELDMQDSSENALYWGLTALSAIDQRHLQSFRYYMTGSPFEYTLVRKLWQVRRQFLVDN
jgi:phospholipid-binding lipoprotein MlaA